MTRTIFISLVALALISQIAFADEPTNAEKLYDQGQAAFDAKQFGEAVTAWERSYELSKEPGLLFNLGQAYRQRGIPGDCAKAAAAYKKFVELDSTSNQRAVAKGLAAEMDKCAASEKSASTQPPSVTANPAATPTEADVPTNQGRTKELAGLAVSGGGVVLLVTGLYFGHRASALGDEVTKACATGCNWTDYASMDADGRSDQTKQWIFDGLGAAAIITGGALYWLGAHEQPAPSIAITPRRDGAAITWGGSW